MGDSHITPYNIFPGNITYEWVSSGISEVTPQEEILELDGWVKI